MGVYRRTRAHLPAALCPPFFCLLELRGLPALSRWPRPHDGCECYFKSGHFCETFTPETGHLPLLSIAVAPPLLPRASLGGSDDALPTPPRAAEPYWRRSVCVLS